MASSALLLFLAAEAAAAKRVVVLDFDGRGAEDAQEEVEELVKREGTLLTESTFRRTQKRLGVKKLNESGMARIAAELSADAFIEGALERGRRRGYTLVLTVREGKTGAVTDTLEVSMRAKKLDSQSRNDLAEQLIPALAKIPELGAEEPLDITPGEDTEAAPISTARDPAAPSEAGDDDPVEGAGVEEEVTAKSVDELTRWRYARHAAVDVEAGVSAVRRTLSFTSAPELTSGQRPNGYTGGIVPSVMVTGELYPLAFGKRPGAASGLGIGFIVDRVLLLKSQYDIGGMVKEYDTSQMKLGGGLRYRWNFGDKATLPTLKFIAGYTMLDFTIERGTDDIDLPNVSYSYLDLGAAVRLPLGTPTAAIYVDARYMLFLDTGEIQDPMFYGEGSTFGLDGDLGFELQFLGRGILKVGVRYQRIAYDFDGTGAKTERDGNQSNQDVGGALDQYLSGYVTAGYLF